MKTTSARTVRGTFATDEYLPLFWDIYARLSPEHADFSRMDSGVPYLVGHMREGVVGTVDDVSLEGDEAGGVRYRFEATIPDDEDGPRSSDEYLRQLDAGLRGRVSVGFTIDDIVAEETRDGGWYIDVAWSLLEISDVSVPMDTSAALDDERRPDEELVFDRSLAGARFGRALADRLVDAVATARAADDDGPEEEMPNDDDDRMPDDDDGDDEVPDEDGRPGDHDGEERSMTPEERSMTPEERRSRGHSPPSADVLSTQWSPSGPRRRRRPHGNDDSGRTLPRDVNIHPRERIRGSALDLADLDLGNYLRAAVDPNRYRTEAARELAWMESHLGTGIYRSEEGAGYIPFALLAVAGPRARARAASRAARGIEEGVYLERYMPAAEHAHAELIAQGEHQRTMTQATTSAGAATSTLVDLARSIMWLTEMDRALEMMTVVPGLSGQWAGFFGNAKPGVAFPGEGNNLTETTPTLTQLTRLPVTMGMYWSISTAQLSSADAPIAAMIEAGCEAVFRTQAMRAFLSGNRNAANFAIQSNSFNGLMNSGITETGFGAAVANLDRDDMVDARRRLFASEVDMMDLGWILSNSVASQLEKTRVGGTESIRFVYEDGRVDSGAERIAARDSVHLGKTTGNAGSEAAVNDVAVLLQRSAAVCLIWGAGIAFNGLQIPGRTRMEFDLQIQSNFAMLNPARAQIIKRG